MTGWDEMFEPGPDDLAFANVIADWREDRDRERDMAAQAAHLIADAYRRLADFVEANPVFAPAVFDEAFTLIVAEDDKGWDDAVDALAALGHPTWGSSLDGEWETCTVEVEGGLTVGVQGHRSLFGHEVAS